LSRCNVVVVAVVVAIFVLLLLFLLLFALAFHSQTVSKFCPFALLSPRGVHSKIERRKGRREWKWKWESKSELGNLKSFNGKTPEMLEMGQLGKLIC